jgi:hypothetical protein
MKIGWIFSGYWNKLVLVIKWLTLISFLANNMRYVWLVNSPVINKWNSLQHVLHRCDSCPEEQITLFCCMHVHTLQLTHVYNRQGGLSSASLGEAGRPTRQLPDWPTGPTWWKAPLTCRRRMFTTIYQNYYYCRFSTWPLVIPFC